MFCWSSLHVCAGNFAARLYTRPLAEVVSTGRRVGHRLRGYALLKALAPAEFKRFSGVHRATFEKMLEALEGGSGARKSRRPAKLALADQLLVALQYWQEYWPYFHSQ